MKIGKLGALGDRKIKSDVVRFSYVPKNERGEEEFVLVFKDSIPSKKEEPNLYEGSKIERRREEIRLTYPNMSKPTLVILTTLKEDNEFRERQPEIVRKYELFKLDD
ncbi:MAG: hypothetical protein QXD43_05725 [Candidatus Aenigmatarchaeota archaeon]